MEFYSGTLVYVQHEETVFPQCHYNLQLCLGSCVSQTFLVFSQIGTLISFSIFLKIPPFTRHSLTSYRQLCLLVPPLATVPSAGIWRYACLAIMASKSHHSLCSFPEFSSDSYVHVIPSPTSTTSCLSLQTDCSTKVRAGENSGSSSCKQPTVIINAASV